MPRPRQRAAGRAPRALAPPATIRPALALPARDPVLAPFAPAVRGRLLPAGPGPGRAGGARLLTDAVDAAQLAAAIAIGLAGARGRRTADGRGEAAAGLAPACRIAAGVVDALVARRAGVLQQMARAADALFADAAEAVVVATVVIVGAAAALVGGEAAGDAVAVVAAHGVRRVATHGVGQATALQQRTAGRWDRHRMVVMAAGKANGRPGGPGKSRAGQRGREEARRAAAGEGDGERVNVRGVHGFVLLWRHWRRG